MYIYSHKHSIQCVPSIHRKEEKALIFSVWIFLPTSLFSKNGDLVPKNKFDTDFWNVNTMYSLFIFIYFVIWNIILAESVSCKHSTIHCRGEMWNSNVLSRNSTFLVIFFYIYEVWFFNKRSGFLVWEYNLVPQRLQFYETDWIIKASRFGQKDSGSKW